MPNCNLQHTNSAILYHRNLLYKCYRKHGNTYCKPRHCHHDCYYRCVTCYHDDDSGDHHHHHHHHHGNDDNDRYHGSDNNDRYQRDENGGNDNNRYSGG